MSMSGPDDIIAELPKLRRFAVSLTGNRPDADDLLQRTVERLLSRPIPDGAHLLKWSFRICRNLWIDEIRSRQVRNPVNVEEITPVLYSEDGERTVMNRLTLGDVDKAMSALPSEQREVISLIAVEGLSYADASDVLDVPIGTIMSRVSRARRNLSKLLHSNDPTPNVARR